MMVAQPLQHTQDRLSTTKPTEHLRWSFFVGAGAGLQDIVPLDELEIPPEARPYLNKRGIYTLNIHTQSLHPLCPAFNLGVSYHINARWRVSLRGSNQNIMQENYHAMVFSADALIGYDFLPHPHHTFYVEAGVGGYFTWNRMNYLWKGKDGDGNQIVIDGVPEEIFVDLGHHNTRNLSFPVKFSYQYNLHGSHWLGAFIQGRANPWHADFAPFLAASAGIEYRYTIGYRKQKMPKQAVTHHRHPYIIQHDTVYIPQVVERVIRDTVYIHTAQDSVAVNAPANPCEDNVKWVLFEVDQHVLPPYEEDLLMNYDFSDVRSVSVTAYTCGLGSKVRNQRLAKQRLDTIVRLLRQRGVSIESWHLDNSKDVTPRFRSVKIELNK